MTDTSWILPKGCESSSCVRWRPLPDGGLEIGTTNDDRTIVLSRPEALAFVDSARRGELIVGAQR